MSIYKEHTVCVVQLDCAENNGRLLSLIATEDGKVKLHRKTNEGVPPIEIDYKDEVDIRKDNKLIQQSKRFFILPCLPEARVENFDAIMRKEIASLPSRLQSSTKSCDRYNLHKMEGVSM